MAGQRRTSTIDVDDAAFLRGLQAALDRIELQTERDLIRLALRVQNAARELCAVDTGRLRSSIVHVKGSDARGPYVDIGTNVEYATHVEYGTVFMVAQPFLRPAFAEAVGYAGSTLGGG